MDRYDNRLDDLHAGENQSRTISKGYYFFVDGKEYRGFVIYKSDEAYLNEGETRPENIRYLSFFPYINKPSALSDFSQMGEVAIIYHIFAPIACIFLLRLVIRASKKEKKREKQVGTKKNSKNSTVKTVETDIEAKNLDTRSGGRMFCSNCGNKLREGAAFCSNCGTKGNSTKPQANVNMQTSNANVETSNVNMQPSNANVQPSNLIGFSDNYMNPEIIAAADQIRKGTIGCFWILVLVPLIGFPIAGLLIDDYPFGESIVIGVGIALFMLVINLIYFRSSKEPMWEGVVVNKYSKEKYEHRDRLETYTEFTTVIRTDAGKKKTIVEKNSRRHMYDYLAVGDRVRYHPRLGTYEKYDKSKDRIIYCNICNVMNPIQNDRCKKCNNLLLK